MKNFDEAWKKVKSNKGCAGIDKQSISDFQKQSEVYLREIQRAVKNGMYMPMPTLRKFIPKSNKKLRPLGIPTVKDRVLQQATKNVIEQIFEMKFLDCSYGYRPDRNAQRAVKQIKNYIEQGYTWVIDADVEKFFDSVDHNLLMSFVAEEISDGKVLSLIEAWLKAGVMNQGKQEETPIGTPQGGVISPLLANIYLHEMDEQIIKTDSIRLVRYADDFVLLCKTKEDAEKAMEQVKNILTKLKLRLNKTKTKIVNVNREHFEFLGFKLKRTFGRLHITPRRDAIKKFKNTVRRITCRDQPMKPKLIAGKLNSVIRGWGNYFKIGDVTKIFKRLDCWIRTRMRTFIEKKKSHYANIRITNYVLKSKYKLASLMTLI
ncbi:MAG TPA: group II intron reverse transcriptase/maturase [Candidatus Thermoplasmatota archaeon]|nr:group II intron reverse transcriptase/maturase [Candidatus Thermoplasmatota archaeon]